MDPAEARKGRVELAAERLAAREGRGSITFAELARRIGIPRQTMDKLLRGEVSKHWPAVAHALGVPLEWLMTGSPAPEWVRSRVFETAQPYLPTPSVQLVGAVTAGDGLVTYDDEPRPMRWKPSWVLMRVEGMSAYPVIYPKQFAVVDTDRPIHHNNMVVIQVDNADAHARDPEVQPRVRAYLKRYCVAPEAPNGYLLASINSGRDTPYIQHDRVLVILPVVGVLFEDPEKSPTPEPALEVL